MLIRGSYLCLGTLAAGLLGAGMSLRPDVAAASAVPRVEQIVAGEDASQSNVWPVDGELRDSSAASFRAFWADAFVAGFKSTGEIDSMVSQAVTGRYNAIIAEVLAYQDRTGTGHGAYWNSSIVPKAQDISGGIDPLAYLVQQGHANGLEVHAWIVPYRVSKNSWPPSGNATVRTHPEWIMVPYEHLGGGPFPMSDGNYVLDPGSPDVQEYLLSIVRELVTNYAIDGINYDYIRYTQMNAGYPSSSTYQRSSLVRFQTLTGFEGVPITTEPTWNDFRRTTVNELVRRTRAEVPSITSNPRQPLRCTADLICSGDAPIDFTGSSAYNQLFQDWRLWMERGWLDAGVPMNYKREYSSSEAAMYRHWVDAAMVWRYQRHMYCGQGNYLNTKADSVTQLSYALEAGADGISNYSYYATADEDMNGTAETDWTWYTYVASNLFTGPAVRPTMPWRDPNLATEGTLWGRVADPATGNAIDGASVQAGTRAAVDTDGNGYYVLTLIPASPGGTAYTVTANNSGCTQVQVSGVVVRPGTVVRQDIGMCNSAPNVGDMDSDGHINATDFGLFAFCFGGPGRQYAAGHTCLNGDFDADRDLDLGDFTFFQRVYGTQ